MALPVLDWMKKKSKLFLVFWVNGLFFYPRISFISCSVSKLEASWSLVTLSLKENQLNQPSYRLTHWKEADCPCFGDN